MKPTSTVGVQLMSSLSGTNVGGEPRQDVAANVLMPNTLRPDVALLKKAALVESTRKGMRYFAPELKSAIDIYSETQREDGMVWDNIYRRPEGKPTSWDHRFGYGGFIRAEGELEFKRIPVEADVEYLQEVVPHV